MRDPEATIQAQTVEFVQAAEAIHETGEEWFYALDACVQIARNDEARMRRHRIASKVVGLIGVTLSDPTKYAGSIYPAIARLERQGVVESTWEPAVLEAPGYPRRRLYRLAQPQTLPEAAQEPQVSQKRISTSTAELCSPKTNL